MTISPNFARPSHPPIYWRELEGSLITLKPLEIIPQFPTKLGVRRATRADVLVVDGPMKGAIYRSAIIFPGEIQRILRRHLNKWVLGRVVQGTPPKPGQAPPWMLTDVFTDGDALVMASEAVATFSLIPRN